MKTRNIHVSVIPANAGIPFHGAIGDSCIRRNDIPLEFHRFHTVSFTGMTRNCSFHTVSCTGMTIIPNSLRK
ncbi:MAG: hypothetical protein NT007_19070 [Candidatus Kapabacteria bacterium]|nr:hypothetical protein [Candidatus Kapabacteria bacterium]